MSIRIDENDKFMPGCSDSALQSARFPVILLTNQSDSSISCRDFLHFRGGIVTRTVINHNNIQLALIIRF